MKYLHYLNRVTLIAIMLIVISCNTQPKQNNQKKIIITTIEPYRIVTQQLVGKSIQVVNLLPPNASPHTWTPLPSDLSLIDKADLIISNGLDLEVNLNKVFEANKEKHLAISSLFNLEALPKSEHQDEHLDEEEQHHHHGSLDPHLWTSPDNMITIVIGLTNELSKRYPMYQSMIRANSELLIKDLKMTQAKISQDRATLNNPSIITFHNSLFYFSQEFGIKCIGYVQSSPGKDPSPKELFDLGSKIKSNKIKAIFIEPQMNPKPALVLAQEFGLKVITYDPLGATLKLDSIIDYYNKVWDILKSGL